VVDRYTKLVLTIIAACLVWNIITGGDARRAWAQYPTHVIVDSWGAYVATFPIPVRVEQ
jgi:hypothetical protein